MGVEEDEESVMKYADLCFQFLRLNEEVDFSIDARTVDQAAMYTKDRPPGVGLPRQSLEYACEDASCSSNRYKADEDGPYQSGSNGIGTWKYETSEAVQFDAREVGGARSVDVFELCGADDVDFNAFDEVPLSDGLRDVFPSPGLPEASVGETGRYSTMSKRKWKEGTDGADPPPGMSTDGGGLYSTESRGKRKEEADVEDPPSKDDEPPKEPIDSAIADVFLFFRRARFFSDWRFD